TGMRDNVVWGLYIVNFIFFIGISYGGAILAGLLHLFKVPWRRPIMRIAGLTAVVSAMIGPIFIILCIGRFDRLHYLFIHARLQSPIVWDVVAISTYFVGAVLFVYLFLIKDFAIYRDSEAVLGLPAWRQKLYRFLALNYKDTASQRRQLAMSRNLMALIMIPMVVVVSSVLSWIFGMTLRPGWHSTIFGPYFVLAAIYSGTGVIVLVMWTFRKIYHLQDYLTDKHFKYMGFILLALGSGYGYFTFSEYLTGWFGSERWDSEVLDKLFDPSEYGWWFLVSNIFTIVIPILVMAFKKLRTPNLITLAAMLMVFGMWVKRYLIVVPTLETPLLPVQDTRPEYIHYSATWVEWALTFAGFATFLLFFTLVAKLVTIVTVSDYNEEHQ
nr:polysulfide reductase NrfD [Saprospiraceae bacterium]